jgi:hypothetical protein
MGAGIGCLAQPNKKAAKIKQKQIRKIFLFTFKFPFIYIVLLRQRQNGLRRRYAFARAANDTRVWAMTMGQTL